jgi:hypothetical protein
MTSSCSLIFKHAEERAPTGVVNTLGEMVVTHHPCHVQVFHTNVPVPLSILLRGLEMEIAALATDLEVLTGHLAPGFAPTMTALLAAADGALRMRQPLLALAIVAGGSPPSHH